jgi:glutaredoxin 2
MAATSAVPAAPPLKLYMYDICPWAVIARAIFGLKKVDHQLIFLGYHDVATPVGLVGVKRSPILQLPSGEAFPESADIVKYVDAHYGDGVLLKEASGREDLAAWSKRAVPDFTKLVWPRAGQSPLPEFAQKQARDTFRESKEQVAGSAFSELLANTPQLLKKAEQHLVDLDAMLFSDRVFDEAGMSHDDLFVFGMVRGLTLVKGLTWPTKLRAYVEYFSEAADIPLLNAMAI